mgnify:CR=1 FL=1
MRGLILVPLLWLSQPVLAEGLPVITDPAAFRGAAVQDLYFPGLLDCARNGAAACWEKTAFDSDCHLFNVDDDPAVADRCLLSDAATWESVLLVIEAEALATVAAAADERARTEGREPVAVARMQASAAAFRAWRLARCEEEEAAWLSTPDMALRSYAMCLIDATTARIDDLSVWGQP